MLKYTLAFAKPPTCRKGTLMSFSGMPKERACMRRRFAVKALAVILALTVIAALIALAMGWPNWPTWTV